MGRIRKGNLTGVIGNLAYSSYKGRQVIKIRPKIKAKASPAQINQRNKLGVVNAFMKSIKKVVAVGFQDSDKLSAYNECVSELLKNSLKFENKVHRIDYPLVKISRGLLPVPEIESVEIDGKSISISWNTSTKDVNSRKNDELYVLVHEENGVSVIFDGIGLRTGGSGVVNVPAEISQPYHVWLFFCNPKMHPYESKKKVSDSLYLGMF